MRLIKRLQPIKRFLPLVTVLAVLIALVTAFWAPTLFDNKSLIHGDSLLHSLPLWRYYEANINTPENLLWDKYTYGGHPLFAEGQGGFVFPLHMLLARIMSPEYANNFAHWAEMILAGIALVGLGRLLKLSYWACGFASIATIFSSYWLQMQQNMTIGAAAMLIPWLILAAEYWIQRTSWPSAYLFGIAAALGVFAGYPQCLHGAVIYIIASLLAHLLTRQSRADFHKTFRSLLKTGLLAAVIAIGLAATQLLPLLELTRYSHRSDGTAAPFFTLPVSLFLRGLLYALKLPELDPPNFFQVIGSLLTCLLFTLSIFFRLNTRLMGHAIAALLLLNLGIGGASPLTRIIYDYHLIPGMHYFRQMMPYLLVAIVGISLIAASSIDLLTRALQAQGPIPLQAVTNFMSRYKIRLSLFVLVWLVWFSIAGFDIPVSVKHAAIVIVALIGVVVLSRMHQSAVIPVLMFFLLVIEVGTMKLHEFHFGDINILKKPLSAAIIEADSQSKEYKLYSLSKAFLYAPGSPHQAGIDKKAQTMLAQMCGLSNLGWHIPSMMGALALPLRERMLIDPILESESAGIADSPAGLRLIDLLSVRYIAADGPVGADSFRVKYHDPTLNSWLIENTAAKPRFQTYSKYLFVDSSEAALQVLRSAQTPTLALEIPSFLDRKLVKTAPPPAPSSAKNPQILFTLLQDKPTRYRLSVAAKDPGWLFLADANYPGWHAYIDGNETPVYSAQILGKAIYVPRGNHEVSLRFKSESYEIGKRITLAFTVVVLLTAIALYWLQRRHS